MAKVSVVIPVYNADRYLKECLDSVLQQTLTDIEVICVDDGSVDRSGEILDDYTKKDMRVKVFHNTNAGYGKAMNIGLTLAMGEYIGIVESDDRVLPEYYERLYTVAIENELDLIKTEPLFWWSNPDYKYKFHLQHMEAYFGKVLTGENRDVYFKFYMNTWSGIYRRQFLVENNIWHNETAGASYQDNGFWFLTMSYCNRGMWLDEAYYLYRQDNPGASVKDLNKVMAMSKEYDYIADELCKRKMSFGMQVLCNYYRLMREWGNYYRIADECKKEFCEVMLEHYKEYGMVLQNEYYFNNWYKNFIKEPYDFTDRLIRKKYIINSNLEKAKKIYIYGAGKRGQKLYRFLLNMGYYKKVAGFIVTKKETENIVCTLPVFQVDELNLNDEVLVIISPAEKSEYYIQMESALHKIGDMDYMGCDDIFESYYSLC